MKTRLDFVSNSSSCSFMLVGAAFDDNEIRDAWLNLHPEDRAKLDPESDKYDEYLSYDMPDKLAGEIGLEFQRGISDYHDQCVIGLPFERMENDETKQQFMHRIESTLKRAFSKNVNVSSIVDGGTDN